MSDIDMNVDVGSQQDVVGSLSQDSQQVSVKSEPSTQSSEPMLPQSKVNEILKARLAEDRAKRAQSESYQQSISQQSHDQKSGQLTSEDVKRLIDERALEISNQQTAQRVMNEFADKILSAAEKYPDYEEKVAQLNFRDIAQANPNMILVLNAVDNSGDVAYEIANNPGKFAAVFSLSQTHPHLAKIELEKLSNSIKQNESAKKQPIPNEPLSYVSPSNIGTGNGSQTVNVRDEKRNPLLRA